MFKYSRTNSCCLKKNNIYNMSLRIKNLGKNKSNKVIFWVGLLLLVSVFHANGVFAFAPTANFSVDNAAPVVGQSITFTDSSTGSPSQWEWKFEPDGVGTTTDQNPVVYYTTPGLKNIILKASNGNGSNTKSKNNYIDVRYGLYYYDGTGNPAEVSNWNSNRDGISGYAPASFTTGYQNFIIINGKNCTTSAKWTVSGTDTKIIIEDGARLIANFEVDISTETTLQLDNGATYEHNNNTTSIWNGTEEIGATSTVSYGLAGNQNIAALNYGNLNIASSGTKSLLGNTTINGNLLIGAGTTLSAGTYNVSHGGNFTNNSTFTPGTGTVTFNGSGVQTIGGNNATNFNSITINNAAGVSMAKNATVNGTLTLTSGNLSLSDYNLTLGAAATISGVPNGSRMIETNGTGSLIKQSTTAGGLNMTYPVGTGSLYNPMILSSTSGAVAGTALVSVRAVAGLAPNTSATDLNKHWIVSTQNLTSYTSNASFAYVTPNDVNGTQSEYVLQSSTAPAVTWSTPNNPSASGVNPMTTTGTSVLEGTWSARELTQTWYSLRSGNWNDPNIWTLDPAGLLLVNPSSTYPQEPGDNVVIKNGKKVLVNLPDLKCKNLTVEGSLDFALTAGHEFNTINGNGRILLASNNWPVGDATHFTSAGQGEGTVVFYGNSFSLPSPRTYYNMEVMMEAGQTLTLLSDYTLNGNLEVKSGTFKINDDSATSILTLIVKRNVTVSSGANISTGLGRTNGTYSISGNMPSSGNYHKIYHQFEIWGDFTNNGVVRFTNQTNHVYNQFTNTGAVSVWFKGLTNNVASCNGRTDFYNLIIDKGTDQTYILELNASATSNFALYGPNNVGRNESAPFSALNPEIRKALWIKNGTLKLTGDLTIPTLSEGGVGGGNGDYAIGGNACLWIASNNVSVYSTAQQASQLPSGASGFDPGSSNQGLSLFGKYRISAGTFATRNSAGLIFWSTGNAVISVEGGTTTVAQFRSASSGGGQTSYSQSGGILKVDGIGEVTSGYPIFGFDSADGVFVMSGGEIQILGQSGNANDVYLPIKDGNHNVTGGNLTLSVNGNITLDYNSNVPFYNVDISRLNTSNTAVVNLKSSMKVLNDLSIGNNSTLATNNLDVAIGKDFSIAGTASTYNAGTNTTTFNGDKNSVITNASTLWLSKVVINKSAHTTLGSFYEVTTSGSAQLNIASDLTITNGAFNTGSSSSNVAGNIAIVNGQITGSVAGVPSTGKIVLNKTTGANDGTAAQTLSGAGLNFGSVTINNSNRGVQLLTDVIVNDFVFNAASSAKVNMGVYNLTVNGTITNNAATRYMYGAGNASDGGLSLYVSGNGAKTYPIGTATKYTPAVMTVSGYGDDGYVTVVPVNNSLATTNPAGGILMPYYWKTKHSEFTTLPSVIYAFTYAETNNTGYYPGKVLDVSPYTRSYINNVNKVDEASKTILFDTPFTLEKANYTAGAAGRFGGSVIHYYSKGGDWAVATTWDKNSKGSGVHEVPALGSIVHIYNDATGNGRVNCNATISAANAPAEIVFEHNYTLFPNHTSEQIPRLQFWVAGTSSVGRVIGTGMLSFNATSAIILNGDFGDFATNPDSYYLYFGGGATITNIPSPIPNLMFEGTAKNINQAITVNTDFIVQGGTTITPYQDIDIKRDLCLGMWSGGSFQFRGSGTPVTISVGRNIDFTKDPSNNLGTRTIVCEASSTNIEHKLIVNGDIIHGTNNSSTFDLYNGATNRNRVVLELSGTGVHNYSRASTAVPDFYRIVINKGVDQTSTFTFNQDFTIYSGGNNSATKSITMQNGSLIMNSANFTNFNLTSGGENFAIPSASALVLAAGTYTANGASGIDLGGLLKVSGGSLDMTGGDNPIIFGAGGASTIDVSAGTLTVGGQIRRAVNSDVGILKYYQSGGNVYVGRTTTGAVTRGTFEVMGAGSVLSITGGDLYIERAASSAVPGLYLMPATTSLATANTIHIGSAAVGNQTIGIYASPSLQNLDVLNGSTAQLITVPLNLNGNLSVTNGSFNANGLDLNIGGNFINNATFTHGNNTTTFNGSVTQAISGSTPATFYNLSKTKANTLTINTGITIANNLAISSGTLADNSNTISVKGDLSILGTHQYGGGGKGILLDNATAAQNITGSGTIGMLTINNTKGVNVPVGNLLTINNKLRLEAGVFNIDQNLLTLNSACLIEAGNPFSVSNMIRTNVSFTDNGVKKVFPAGASGLFTFPIGSGGKYTPVTFDVAANGNSTGSIRVKPAAECHSSIQENSEAPDVEIVDRDNVLQYYWTLISSGISGFNATATMKYEQADVKVTNTNTEANYIAARLLSDGQGTWNKPFGTVDAVNNLLTFTYTGAGDAEISGDYTAGINNAIPAKVPRYRTMADGLYSTQSIWSLYDENASVWGDAGVGIPVGGPRGSIAIVDHMVTSNSNDVLLYSVTINGPTGKLSLGSTYGNRLGNVDGNGTFATSVGDLPAADFTEFFKATGGTIEYDGTSGIDILTDLPVINNLALTGTGIRTFPNINIQLLGNLIINGPTVNNDTYDKAIGVKGNITFDSGTFTAGNQSSAKLIMNGAARQTIGGMASFTTTTNDLFHFEINNPVGVILNNPVDISGNLTLSNGFLTTTKTNILTMTSVTSSASVGSSASFVDGPLVKQLSAGGAFAFPIGNTNRFGPITVENASASGLWRSEYFNNSANNQGFNTASITGDLAFVSQSEYWNVNGPASSTAKLLLRWDDASGVNPVEPDLRAAQWITSSWFEVPISNKTGTELAGTVTTSTVNFNANAGGNYITFGSINIPRYDWLGGDSNWFDKNNWKQTVIPSAGTNITIDNVGFAPIINSTTIAQVNNLTIASDASLTLEAGSRLTVNGNLVTNSKLIVKNTVTQPASLITYGTVTGETQYQWSIPKSLEWYMAHPVNGVTEEEYRTSYGTDRFAVSAYTTSGWARVAGYHSPVSDYIFNGPVLDGYVVYAAEENDLNYSGILHNDASYLREYNKAQWYLVANPYPAYMDVEDAGFGIDDFLKTVYIRKSDYQVSSYNILNKVGVNQGSRYVSPGQSVWLRTYNATSSLTISKSVRTHASGGYGLKSGAVPENDRLRLMLQSEHGTDESVVIFNQNGSETYTAYDSEKLMNGGNMANLYSVKSAKNIAVNSLPELSSGTVVPLAYQVAAKGMGQMTLKATNLRDFMPEVTVYLKDKVAGVTVDLRETPSYTFTPSVASANDRFELKFETLSTDVGDIKANATSTANKVLIYGVKQRAHVKVDKELLYGKNRSIKVYNVAGQLMATHELNGTLTEFDLPQRDAAFIIRVNIDGVAHKAVVIGMD